MQLNPLRGEAAGFRVINNADVPSATNVIFCLNIEFVAQKHGRQKQPLRLLPSTYP
jgi:hypothetical protein